MSSEVYTEFCRTFTPMLISAGELRSLREGWVFEPKLDGMRGIAFVNDGICKIFSRHGKEHTRRFPVIVEELSRLKGTIVLDGEIVCSDYAGRACLETLQQRILMDRQMDIDDAERKHPAHFFAFDVVFRQEPLLNLSLRERKEILRQICPNSDYLRFVNDFPDSPETLFELCIERGLEGIVAKRPESRYYPGVRSNYWLKIKQRQTDSFVIGGYKEEHGFLVGQYDQAGRLLYCGNVEAGFRNADYDYLWSKLVEGGQSPFSCRIKQRRAQWFKPEIVIDVQFLRWTPGGVLREGVFKGFRNDLPPDAAQFKQIGPGATPASADDP